MHFTFLVRGLMIVLLFAAVLPAVVTPIPAHAAGDAESGQSNAASVFIQDIGNRAIAIMANQALTPDQRSQQYKQILQDAFDLPTISHFVLGRNWAAATSDQQKRFLDLYKQMILQTYGSRLNFYSGEKFQVTGSRQEDNSDNVVTSQITHLDNSKPTTIDWRVRTKDGKSAVLDVVIEGVSQSVTQRQEYSSIIQRNNGNIDGLLAAMEQQLQK